MTTNNNPRKRSRKAPQAPAVSWTDPSITQGGDPLTSQPPAEAPQAPEAQAPEAQAPTFDLAAFMAQGMKTADGILTAKSAKSASTGQGQTRQRVTWPKAAQDAASAAGLRLPGLYPKPGSRSARGANGNGWFRELPKSGKPGQPERNDLARSILWELACRDLATTEEGIPTAQLLAAAAVIRRTYQRDEAQAPEWSLYLVAPAEKRPDGTVIGQGTCLLHQAALMAGEAVILTPERIRRV